VQRPVREAHPLGARICAGCPVRRPCAQDAPVDNDQNHLRAGILLPAESMRPAWLGHAGLCCVSPTASAPARYCGPRGG